MGAIKVWFVFFIAYTVMCYFSVGAQEYGQNSVDISLWFAELPVRATVTGYLCWSVTSIYDFDEKAYRRIRNSTSVSECLDMTARMSSPTGLPMYEKQNGTFVTNVIIPPMSPGEWVNYVFTKKEMEFSKSDNLIYPLGKSARSCYYDNCSCKSSTVTAIWKKKQCLLVKWGSTNCYVEGRQMICEDAGLHIFDLRTMDICGRTLGIVHGDKLFTVNDGSALDSFGIVKTDVITDILRRDKLIE